VAVLDGDELLLALGGGAQQNKDALTILFQADVQVDAIGPDVDVFFARQVALGPSGLLVLPGLGEPADGAG